MSLPFPSFVDAYLPWIIAGAIVLLGLFVYGFRDVVRFSTRRALAIAGVCFDESIRRRVLWITPLAIVGAIAVVQLSQPVDAQDAIRQTIKYCLFTTGLVITVTAIILASTNLPKEIENRVIYTIVTKPATRLEIIVGKVLGFASVSAAILLIMGLFTFAYLHLRAYTLRKNVQERLAIGDVDQISRPSMEYYARVGLLNAKTFSEPDELRIYSRVPDPADDRFWMFGGGADQDFIVPFVLTPELLIPQGAPPDTAPGAAGLYIRLNVGYAASEAARRASAESIPFYIANPTTQPLIPSHAVVSVNILDEEMNTILADLNKGQPIFLNDPEGTQPVLLAIPPQAAASILKPGAAETRIYVQVMGESQGVEYFVTSTNQSGPVSLIVPGATQEQRTVIQPPVDPDAPYRIARPIFRGRMGTYGQQLRGGKAHDTPVGIYQFRRSHTDPPVQPIDGRVPFELKVGIERSGEDEDAITRLQLTVVNRATGFTSPPIEINPESTRTSYFTVPAEAVGEGNFDVHIKNLTNGNYIGLLGTSLTAVASEQSFDWNLFKSLLILWLMSLLVVIIAIFASTFLSWPIAIVLTIVLMLGHWAVLQLGEDVGPGIGARIAEDMKFDSPGVTSTAAQTVEALSRLLRIVSNVLPDIGKFAAVEDIERGVTISQQRLLDPLTVLATFGLPVMVLAYVILRNKEVAP
jgi:ABC-type transport system involved in multi-copper enzyme maturation permease subunit